MNQYLSWENMYPNPPQHWGSAIYYDDNFQYPSPPWIPPGNGVTMADGYITASYNALNQPVAMWSFAYSGTPNLMFFGVDPLGRCVKRWVSSSGDPTTPFATFLYYDSESLREQGGWNLIQEGTGASAASAQRLYIHGGRVDEIVKSINYGTGQSAFHHYDARGHCTLLTDVSGNVLEQYDYDAFGFPYFYDRWGNSLRFYDTASSWRGYSPYGNRFLFTGREWLSDLKLYDFRNRMYQPELGRFLQPDPKEFGAGDYNLYRYCHNDPVNKSDAMGLEGHDPVKVDEIKRTPLGSNIPVTIRVFHQGNWNDRKISNHSHQNLKQEIGKDGLTLGKAWAEGGGTSWDVHVDVSWWYDSRHEGTDVVTRELEHVQGYRDLSSDLRYTLNRDFPQTLGSLSNRVDAKYSRFIFDQNRMYHFGSSPPHDIISHPLKPVTLPEYEDTH